MIDLNSMSDDDKLAALESIHKSIAESKEVQKQKIAANVNLVLQALKKMESDIRARYDETGKAIEKRVANIKDGRDGQDGVDGQKGKDGRPGRDGLPGARGIDGLNGSNGIDGQDGISITDAHIDFDGSLIITLSDGKLLNVGEVVSQDIAEKIKIIQTMSTNGAVGIKDEGSSISTGVKNINFVGATVTATNSGDDVTVNVSAGTGTVTSVAVSGGSTGLTTSGGPITTTGTITLGGTLAVASGGTGTATPGLVAGTNITSITGSWPNQTINASGGSGTVTSVAATGGTGISVSGSPITTSGTLTITNTAPDQTVVLTSGTGISTTGTYPNFTIANTAPDQTVALTQGGTTTITGTYPNFTISSADQFVGTVTSVTGTSPVASSGGTTPAISLASGYGDTLNPYASKTANFVLAAPNGTAGVPTFRAVVAADIPTLNQNTTGSAATVTTTINPGVVATTQSAGDNSTKVATTAYVNAITGTNGITDFKNRLINSAMVIDQRNAGASVTQTSSYPYTLDRWQCGGSVSSKFTVQQSSTAPTGFVNSSLITSSSAYTVGAGENFVFFQNIEGYNTADLMWGTANAQTVTLSFWVRSSLTGTFGGAIQNSATNRSYPFTYTISVANTFEYKTVTIAGDTSGTWLTTNGVGIIVRYGLGVGATSSGTAGAWAGANYLSATGAVSVVGTSGATFYITGVQLEKGSTATSFDYRPYGTELALCQRYLYAIRGSLSLSNQASVGVGCWDGSNGAIIFVPFPVQLRVYPSSITVSSVSDFQCVREAIAWENATAISLSSDGVGVQAASLSVLTATRDTRGFAARMRSNSATAYLGFNAEL
jgi:hypothetical protein